MFTDFTRFIIAENLEYFSQEKPLQSVWLEFVRRNIGEILNLGEFEALRRWLLSGPVVMPMPVSSEDSHRITRDFYKALRKEQKA